MARPVSSISNSPDRANVDAMIDAGLTNAEIAAASNFHVATVGRYAQELLRRQGRRRATYCTAPACQPEPVPPGVTIAREFTARCTEVLC